jgi:hypothetical protein
MSSTLVGTVKHHFLSYHLFDYFCDGNGGGGGGDGRHEVKAASNGPNTPASDATETEAHKIMTHRE